MTFSGLTILTVSLFAQNQMQVATYNFTGFSDDKKTVTTALLKSTPTEFQNHPEFGINPYRTPCHDCLELIQKRDLYSRYYIESNDPSRFYVQKSYFQLHYKDEQGFLRTADPRLEPDAHQQEVYNASNQPVPTLYDKNQHKTVIEIGDFSFGFNNRLNMHWASKTEKRINEVPVNFNQTTIGESGVMTINAWNKIDIRQLFETGSVKTDFIIKEPLEFPEGADFLVFEDALKLPDNYTVERSSSGAFSPEGYWTGDLYVKRNGNSVVKYKKPLYHDGIGVGITGLYDIDNRNGNYTVKVMIPVSFLNDPNVQYPIYIDPFVSGRDSVGHFFASGFYANPLTFTSQPGTCDWTITVQVPGKCELVDAIIDVEYKNPTAFCAPQPDPICKFSDVRQWVQGPCFNFGPLACNPALPPYVGTCTTDPTKVPGAGALAEALLVTCVPPQCPDYFLDFTLQNQTRQCPETCDSNCAAGSFFAVTVVGRTIELDVEADRYEVCAEEEVQLTSKPTWGVPPYTYVWTIVNVTDTISPIHPIITHTYIDTAFDQCGMWAVDSLTISVKPTPTANAGPDTSRCDGDPSFNIGGNPTSPVNSTSRWSALPANAIFYLSDTTASNPVANIPIGTTGAFEYLVRVEDALCFQYDTMIVNVAPIPIPVIVADTLQICEGEVVTLSVTQPFAQYQWSNGETSPSIGVTQSGIYSVSVSDAIGCTGAASSQQVTVIPALSFLITANPGTSIELGNSVTLGADIDLEGSQVRDYFWNPNAFITCVDSDCPTPVATPPADQIYSLTVVSVDSCITTNTLLIHVIPPESFVIPSAFSPNNDGKNDQFFIIKASGVTVKEFKVFNRWGQLLHNDTTPWDGFYKDKLQEMAVYSYLFVLQFFDGRESKEHGSVTLIR